MDITPARFRRKHLVAISRQAAALRAAGGRARAMELLRSLPKEFTVVDMQQVSGNDGKWCRNRIAWMREVGLVEKVDTVYVVHTNHAANWKSRRIPIGVYTMANSGSKTLTFDKWMKRQTPGYDRTDDTPMLRMLRKCWEDATRNAVDSEELNPWKGEIINVLVVCWILNSKNQEDPKQALADIIQWHIDVNNDPAVNGPQDKPLLLDEEF